LLSLRSFFYSRFSFLPVCFIPIRQSFWGAKLSFFSYTCALVLFGSKLPLLFLDVPSSLFPPKTSFSPLFGRFIPVSLCLNRISGIAVSLPSAPCHPFFRVSRNLPLCLRFIVSTSWTHSWRDLADQVLGTLASVPFSSAAPAKLFPSGVLVH